MVPVGLGQRGLDEITLRTGQRGGTTSTATQLTVEALHQRGCRRIIHAPLADQQSRCTRVEKRTCQASEFVATFTRADKAAGTRS